MKKGLLLVVVMLATIAVKAQDIYVGGSLNVWRNSTGNTTSFKVAPEVGYNFNETWALGAELDYSHNYNGGLTKNSVIVAPYIRWSYCETGAVRLFLDGTAALGFVKVKDGDTTKAGQVGLRPGIAVKLNDHFSFLYYLLVRNIRVYSCVIIAEVKVFFQWTCSFFRSLL